MTEPTTIKWGGWELDGRNVLKPRQVRLIPLEAKVLEVLLKAHGNPMLRWQLIEQAETTRSSLRTSIKGLRRALGNASIITEGESYRVGFPDAQDPLREALMHLGRAQAILDRLVKSQKAGL